MAMSESTSVPEVGVMGPALMGAARIISQECGEANRAFLAKKNISRNPEDSIEEGIAVTRCAHSVCVHAVPRPRL